MTTALIQQAQDQTIDATADALSERIEFTWLANRKPSDSFWTQGIEAA